MELSNAVKLIRVASGMKQKEVAEDAGVSSNYLSLVENGKREPSVGFLRKLAKILGVPVGLFFAWEDQAKPGRVTGIEEILKLVTKAQAMILEEKAAKGRIRGRR
jgi:transcriptional regulator with XRE-family HTH domain